jgi:hypothetical protein
VKFEKEFEKSLRKGKLPKPLSLPFSFFQPSWPIFSFTFSAHRPE